jgi:lysophospholipase L1-like esterase
MKKKLLFLSLAFNILFVGGAILVVFKIGSPRYLYYLLKHRGQGIAVIKEQRKNLFTMLPKSEHKIVMLGNSITALCEWSELFGNPNIINRGIIGDGTEDILQRLNDITDLKPTKIFLLIGVNDLLFCSIDQIATNYETIVAKILAETPNSKLYLESILPIHNSLRRSGMRNEDIQVLNQAIQRIAAKYQLTYIDLHSQMKDDSGALQTHLSKDGIHLKALGYQIFKKTLDPYINL